MKKNGNKKKKRISEFFPLFLLIATFFMGIGYAAIGNISLDIKGSVTAKAQKGIFISNVTCIDNDLSLSNNVDFSLNSYVISGTTIHHDVTLAETNISSSKITYDIEIFNNNKYVVMFSEIINEKNIPTGTNNNDNIIFEVTKENENGQYVSLEKNDIILPKKTMKIRITFSYSSSADTSQLGFSNKLDSYINFEFVSYEAIYELTGDYQFYKVPFDGIYKIQLWGAQGGGGPIGSTGTIYAGGTGGYVSGEIELKKNDILYVYVGGKGQDYPANENTERYTGGYNGGGDGFRYAYAGGGATDIRYFGSYTPTTEELEWNSALGLKSRIIVAGGGGASATDYNKNGGAFSKGGPAGGLTGFDSITGSDQYDVKGLGASQTSGYAFGKGYNAPSSPTTSYAGGGSGYYGSARSTGSVTWNKATGGGSSFISGHTGSIAIISNSSTSPRNDSNGTTCVNGTTDNLCSIHYSNKTFNNTVMIDGNGCSWTSEVTEICDGMPSYDGTATIIGNTGNGYAKITIVSISE